jgi:Protein of unknown function (DUF3014)
MAHFDDVPFRLSPGPEPTERPPSRPMWPAIAAAGIVVALLGVWYFGFRKAPPPADTRPAVARTVERPPAEPGEAIDLPPLDQSDGVIRMLVARLSSHPAVAAWLTTNNLIRNLTVVVVNIANGDTPAKHLRPLRPSEPFAVRQSNGAIWLNPSSYSRYDGIGEAVEGVDARGVARFYATVKPRIDEAYRDLAGPDKDFDVTLERAIVLLLRTPVVDRDVQLRTGAVSYEYADPALQELSKAQRQFLRMGPRNVRRVQAKLREVARYLGIPDSALPPQ